MKYGNLIRRMVAPLLILSFLVGCDGGDWEGMQEGPWLMNEQVESWHGRIRNLIKDGTRFLPVKVGAVAAIMVDLLWPKSRRDIWKLIQEDVERTINREITKNILRERQAELEALQRNIKSYSETERLIEKGNYLTVCLPVAYHTLKGEKRKSVTVSNPEWVLHNEDQEGTLYRIILREYNAIDKGTYPAPRHSRPLFRSGSSAKTSLCSLGVIVPQLLISERLR